MKRVGLIAKKAGSTRVYNSDGVAFCGTVLSVDQCRVVSCRVVDGGYYVQVGAFSCKLPSKPLAGHYKVNGVDPCRILRQFFVSESYDVGTELSVNHFIADQAVDVTCICDHAGGSKGKGFAGPMKRYGFRGLRATHGVSVSHRSHGSTGQRQDPGKVFKGKKMAGHMGAKRVTVKNLVIHDVLYDNGANVLVVKGSVPGPRGAYFIVRDSLS